MDRISADSNIYDTNPGSYITGESSPYGRETGVQLKSLTGQRVGYSYVPLKNNGEYVSLKVGVPTPMYITKEDDSPLALVKYVSDYEGKNFYIYDESSKTLYFGTFTQGYGNEDTPYKLTSTAGSAKINNYNLPGQVIVKPTR